MINAEEKSGYYVAVDGGGTKTEICVRNVANGEFSSATLGSANYKSSDKVTAAANISTGLINTLERMGVPLSHVRSAVFGIAGCDTEDDMNYYRATVGSLGLNGSRVYICNDAEMVLLSMLDEGICTVAGTGSISIGITAAGRKKRAGGWGVSVSDEGSGWWIANELLKRYLRWFDGMGEYTEYFDDVTERLGSGDSAVAVQRISLLGVEQTASLARDIMNAAAKGDALCADIEQRAAGHIAELTACVWRSLDFEEGKKIYAAAIGSLFNDKRFQKAVERHLRETCGINNLELLKVNGSPAMCGLKLAEKLFEGRLTGYENI